MVEKFKERTKVSTRIDLWKDLKGKVKN